MKQGDLVIRKSYGGDVVFRIESMLREQVVLRGTEYRLLADAPLEDLEPAQYAMRGIGQSLIEKRVSEAILSFSKLRSMVLQRDPGFQAGRLKRVTAAQYFEVPGRVLHVDGDSNYLRKSMALYGQLHIPAEGYYFQESYMAEALQRLLPEVRPDILVVTGHDGLLKDKKESDLFSLNSYKNSHNFVNAVQVARRFERSRDSLAIVAGACQSHYEALMNAGANFASSPARVLIHALDPLYIAARVSYTSIKDTAHITDIVHHTLSGIEGIGGLETKGFFRVGVPRPMMSLKKN